MISAVVLGVWALVGGGIYLAERKLRKRREKAQAWEDEQLGRNNTKGGRKCRLP